MGERPVIGITLGDPAGIGPEIVGAALASGKLSEGFDYLALGEVGDVRPGKPTEHSARLALEAMERAAAMLGAGELDAVVTGPVSKSQLQSVGFAYPGQTEFFAARSQTANFAMCLTGGALTVVLVTAHLPLREVGPALSAPEIIRVGTLLAEYLRGRLQRAPRIAVAGLNPHAGESGALGREEIEMIEPATRILAGNLGSNAEVSGPISPDTVFFRAVRGEFDGVICMYHDQGLIPLKLIAFDSGVNITLGLPRPRTSPDHGTAFEIAGKGMARPDSMIAAIRLAGELVPA